MGEPPLTAWDAGEIAARLRDTTSGMAFLVRPCTRPTTGPWRDLVHHSGRVLQALTFAPTGAIVAAPTTSLPETVGGGRNWDYRYTWVRDASLTMEALWVAACPDEANKFFGFLADAAASSYARGKDLQIMFGIGGEHDLTERELPHLTGWRASRPVRVGNGAWAQRQLDVYGELLGAAAAASRPAGRARPGRPSSSSPPRRTRPRAGGRKRIRGSGRSAASHGTSCTPSSCAGWRWTGRSPSPRSSARPTGSPRWTAAREEIRAAIEQRGWNDQAGAFTQAFGSEDLDASSLMLAITGFLPGDDPRIKATVDAIAGRLTDERGLVYRYLAADGLAGQEGTFLLCTFWLAHAQALAGELDQATATFERAVAAINDVGLLAEEVDPASGEMIGNFPQAFSHIGLVNAAWAIAQARGARAASGPARTPRRGR